MRNGSTSSSARFWRTRRSTAQRSIRFESTVKDAGTKDRLRSNCSISDDGDGISAADVPRVFDRGFTGSQGRTHHKATGMGLYLAAVACDRMGLGLRISSEDERAPPSRALPLDCHVWILPASIANRDPSAHCPPTLRLLILQDRKIAVRLLRWLRFRNRRIMGICRTEEKGTPMSVVTATPPAGIANANQPQTTAMSCFPCAMFRRCTDRVRPLRERSMMCHSISAKASWLA